MKDRVVIVAVLAVVTLLVVIRRPGLRHREGMAAPAIIGGQPAYHWRFPWYVSLYAKKDISSQMGCGGVLVTSQLVLTAAHCRDTNWALLGGTTWVKVGVARRANFRYHPKDDWMLLYLETPTKLMPIKIASRMPAHHALVTVVGRGEKGTPDQHGAFTQTKRRYWDNQAAIRKGINYQGWLHEPNVGMTEPLDRKNISNACKGDSGGPIFVDRGLGKDELVGLIANGNCRAGDLYFCKVAGRFVVNGNGITVPP